MQRTRQHNLAPESRMHARRANIPSKSCNFKDCSSNSYNKQINYVDKIVTCGVLQIISHILGLAA